MTISTFNSAHVVICKKRTQPQSFWILPPILVIYKKKLCYQLWSCSEFISKIKRRTSFVVRVFENPETNISFLNSIKKLRVKHKWTERNTAEREWERVFFIIFFFFFEEQQRRDYSVFDVPRIEKRWRLCMYIQMLSNSYSYSYMYTCTVYTMSVLCLASISMCCVSNTHSNLTVLCVCQLWHDGSR